MEGLTLRLPGLLKGGDLTWILKGFELVQLKESAKLVGKSQGKVERERVGRTSSISLFQIVGFSELGVSKTQITPFQPSHSPPSLASPSNPGQCSKFQKPSRPMNPSPRFSCRSFFEPRSNLESLMCIALRYLGETREKKEERVEWRAEGVRMSFDGEAAKRWPARVSVSG